VESATETSISQLAALQGLDRQLREKTELRQLLEREIAAFDVQLLQQREAASAARSERDTMEARRQELEARLDSEGSKMKDRRMRLNRVRNEKELQALRYEIEVGKETNQQLEEELLGVLESVEGLTAALTQAEQGLADLETNVVAQVAERRQRIAQLTSEIDHDQQARARMTKELDGALLRKYEQIFARRGGTAVVEVRNGTCLGCHMNLPPQFFNELQRARDVRLCPNCHRILFFRPESLESR
jgi:predicted  nucleic acid-binding Zn-ribbon protein